VGCDLVGWFMGVVGHDRSAAVEVDADFVRGSAKRLFGVGSLIIGQGYIEVVVVVVGDRSWLLNLDQRKADPKCQIDCKWWILIRLFERVSTRFTRLSDYRTEYLNSFRCKWTEHGSSIKQRR